MKKFSFLLCLALVTGFFSPLAMAAETAEPEEETAAFDGYIVKLKENAPVVYTLDDGTDPTLLGVADLAEAEAIPAEYVEYIEPNYIVTLLAAPDDPYYSTDQWNLQSIGAEYAFDLGLTGAGVKVGFVDSGIYAAHEDLDDSCIGGADFTKDGKAYTADSTGHGTFAAGIVAAQTNNATGMAGIAPKVQLMAYRAFATSDATVLDVANAVDQAIVDKCEVLNLSFGTDATSNTLAQAIARADAAGIILVAAVGNAGTTQLFYPAAYDSVIGVGAVDSSATVASFSQKNSSVFVTAPGENVSSLGYTSINSYRSDKSGTSYAAPVVTGMAALALEYDKDMTAEGFRYLLQASATDDSAGDGYDTSYGYGIVNIETMLQLLASEFKITYTLNGGALPQDAKESYKVTDGAVSLPVPSRTGYGFGGWYTSSDLSGEAVTELAAASVGDRTFYAAWENLYVADGYEAISATATPESLDGLTAAVVYEADATEWFLYKGSDTLPTDFTCQAELLTGSGTLTVDGTEVTYTPAAQDASTSVQLAVYGVSGGVKTTTFVTVTIAVQPLPVPLYTVTFYSQDVVYQTVTSVPSGSTITLPTAPTRTGYTFGGWYTEAGVAFTSATAVTGDLSLYASWSSKSSSGGGGGGGSSSSSTTTEASTETTTEDSSDTTESVTTPMTETADTALPFTDVPVGAWYYEDVYFTYTNGLFQGTTDTTFSPQTAMSRGMAVTVLYRMAGSPAVIAPQTSFTDLTAEWYQDAVQWATQQGIVVGVGEGRFAPDQEISRQDLAVMLMRYIDTLQLEYVLTQEYCVFSDEGEIADYAKNAVQILYKLGVIQGVGGDTISPKSGATRAEVATMLHRIVTFTELI